MNAVIKGAKGGSKSQRQPKIANDTTASKTYARLQYGMSEGEVEGLANGFKSIFLDDTPVESDSGARNFQDVTLDFRSGTNDQTYMEGFESIASEAAVGVELKSDTPWVKGITNLNLDAVIVRVRFGALKKQDPSNGDVSGIVIDYSIEVQTDGGAWELMLDTKMSGKTSANYERTHRIGLPKANNNWLIRVTRKTPNSSSEYVSDKMYIQAITEVIDLKLTYPNTAVIGVQYDAETFSNIAKFAVDLKGVKIKVPSNYDPVSRTYVGIWDGTFKRAYTNNPAWIYYDLCTNKRYALGNRLTEQMIDKWSLYRLAQYCDQMVNDGKGGQEPRFTCNVYIQSAESAFDILSKLAGVFRAISYWDGASIVCDADLPQDTYFTYTRANVIDGHFEYSGTRARDRHNAVKVAWDNPQNRYKTEYVFVRDEAAIARDRGAVKLLELEAWGCTSEGQAQRAGLWALKSEQLETRTVSFKVGLDGYIPLPGKVIEVADELLAGRANGGRISTVSADRKVITLDRDDVVCRTGDRLVVNGEDGKAQARIVSSKIGRNITVTVAFDSVAAENVWVVDAQDLKTMKFRVMSITQDDKHQFSITGLQYESAKYDAIDFGAFIDDRPISIINPTVQAPVTNVLISSETMVQQGLSIETMLITWDQAQGATKYQIEWRKDDGNWIKLPITGSNSVEVQGIYAGNYEARVTAISAFDIASLPTYSILTTLSGKQGLPPALANIAATGILFGYRLNWSFPAVGALDTAYTEIEIAATDNGANAAPLGLFAYPTTTHDIQGMQPNLTRYFRGRLIDRIGNIGPWSSWVSATTSADASILLDALNGMITSSQLDQDLTQSIILGSGAAQTAEAAQNAANAAALAATNAQAAADQVQAQVTTTTTELHGLLDIIADGLTQEILDRQEGDADVVGQLTTYKTSNDAAMSAVQQQAEAATSASSANATALTNLNTEVAAAHNLASNALQQAQSATDATSTNASNLIALNSRMDSAEQDINGVKTSKLDASVIQQYRTAVDQDSVTAGELTQFKSTLKVGGVNVLLNSKEPRSGVNEYLMYESSVELKDFYDQNLNKDVTVSCEIYVPVAGDVKIYTSNQSAHHFSFGTIVPANQWIHVVATVKPIPHDTNPNWATSSLEFYGEYGTGRIVTVRNVQLEAGNVATSWSPSPRDYAEDAANVASALSETNTRVGSVENGIASQANQLTSLSAKLNERKMYQLYSGGLAAVTGGTGWLRGFDPYSYYYIGRSYGLVVFNGDGSIQSVNSYDVFGGHTQGFIDAVSAVPTGTYAAVLTSDEPQSNNFHIKEALKSLGGSDAVDQLVYRGAYLLVGRKGLPSGQAIEKVSNTTSFGVDYLLEMYNGVPIGLGGSSPQAGIISNMRTEVSNIGGNITSLATQTNTLSTTVGNNTASIQEVSQSVNGLYAQKYIKLDVNGKVAGWGGANDGKESNFILNFDSFAIGSGGSVGYYPFIFRTTPYTDPETGTVFPVGAYLKTAFMDYASVDTAHIKQLAVKSAQIDDLAVTSGKIDDLAVTTLKIQNEAVTVPIGVSKPNIVQTTGAFLPQYFDFTAQLTEWEAKFSPLATITLNRQGGQCRFDASCNVAASSYLTAYAQNNGNLSENDRLMLRLVLSVYKGSVLVGRAEVPPTQVLGQSGFYFEGALNAVAIIDTDNTIGTTTYTLKLGFANRGSRAVRIVLNHASGVFGVNNIRFVALELKK